MGAGESPWGTLGCQGKLRVPDAEIWTSKSMSVLRSDGRRIRNAAGQMIGRTGRVWKVKGQSEVCVESHGAG
jgi:hypothetical protein